MQFYLKLPACSIDDSSCNAIGLDALLEMFTIKIMIAGNPSTAEASSNTKANLTVSSIITPNVVPCVPGCHKPISGRCVTAMSRKFHPNISSALSVSSNSTKAPSKSKTTSLTAIPASRNSSPKTKHSINSDFLLFSSAISQQNSAPSFFSSTVDCALFFLY
ncbi:hypothetical protein TNCT_73531 [Trichonephila clavata]|uniref:Uncharacterized protein n=1 Tax=Trichonephila clavata TaxID=2740835 RepID=A0A8X6KT05_TRICU|nr:hypothetical protein TNCT_73531 [Trichonephila clavata]